MPKNFLAEYCSFSRRERIGIAALLGLILLLCYAPAAWDVLRKDVQTIDTTGFHQTTRLLEVMLKNDSIESRRRYQKYERKPFVKRTYPHNGTYPHKAYRKDSASRFKKYERRPRPVLTTLDINTADTAIWERLPGIGPVLARRIVLFRERLGGFFSIKQVGETYGLADSVFVKIQPLLQLGVVSLRKIDLNKTDEKSLADHPYIDTKLARTIIRYRNSHGPFRSIEGLKAIALVDEVIYRKLENYLVVN